MMPTHSADNLDNLKKICKRNLNFAEKVHSQQSFSYCKEICILQLIDYPKTPSDMRKEFLELLASSVAGEFREVTAQILKYKVEGKSDLISELCTAYLNELQTFVQKYQDVFNERARVYGVTQLEKGLLFMCEKQMVAVQKRMPVSPIQLEENESGVSIDEENIEGESEDINEIATSDIVVETKLKRRFTEFCQTVTNFFGNAKKTKVYLEKERTSPDATILSRSTASPASVSSLGMYSVQERRSPVPMVPSSGQIFYH